MVQVVVPHVSDSVWCLREHHPRAWSHFCRFKPFSVMICDVLLYTHIYLWMDSPFRLSLKWFFDFHCFPQIKKILNFLKSCFWYNISHELCNFLLFVWIKKLTKHTTNRSCWTLIIFLNEHYICAFACWIIKWFLK